MENDKILSNPEMAEVSIVSVMRGNMVTRLRANCTTVCVCACVYCMGIHLAQHHNATHLYHWHHLFYLAQ